MVIVVRTAHSDPENPYRFWQEGRVWSTYDRARMFQDSEAALVAFAPHAVNSPEDTYCCVRHESAGPPHLYWTLTTIQA
jgi:hypothetical protein